MGLDVECSRNALDVVGGNVDLRALDSAHVRAMQARSVGESFL